MTAVVFILKFEMVIDDGSRPQGYDRQTELFLAGGGDKVFYPLRSSFFGSTQDILISQLLLSSSPPIVFGSRLSVKYLVLVQPYI